MKNAVIDREGVKEKFGVYPEKMIELQALVGDSTDNVPGVPGHRAEDRRAAPRRVRRPRNAARPRRRDQAAEAAREPGAVRRAGAHLAQARGALLRRAARRAARRPRGGAGRRREGGRLLQGDGVHRADRAASPTKTGVDPAEIEPATLEIAGWPPGGGAACARARHGRLRAACAGAVEQQAGPTRARAGSAATSAHEWRFGPRDDQRARQARRRWSRRGARAAGDAEASTSRKISLRPAPRGPRALGATAARERGLAFDRGRRRSAPSPMQAEICGIALALEPGFAGYIPLGHRARRRRHFRRRAGEGPDPARRRARSAEARCSRTRPSSRSAQNIKDDWLVLARHGIEMAPIDDVMLMSYALDAGALKHGHGLGELCNRSPRPRADRAQGGRRHRQGQGHASTACRSTAPPATRRRTPTSRCASGAC